MPNFAPLILFFIPPFLFGQSNILKGSVIDRTTKKPIPNLSVRIYYEDYNRVDTIWLDSVGEKKKDTSYLNPKLKLVDSTLSDGNGNFYFYSLKTGLYTVYCRIRKVEKGYQVDERSHININNDSMFVELTPKIYCEYEKYQNQDFCPICFKKDKVAKVVYGLPLYNPKNLDKIFSKKDQYMIGYCEIDPFCYARYYCRKCSKLF